MFITKKNPSKLYLFHIPIMLTIFGLLFALGGGAAVYYTLSTYTTTCKKESSSAKSATCRIKGTLLGLTIDEREIKQVYSLSLRMRRNSEDNIFTYNITLLTKKGRKEINSLYTSGKVPKKRTINHFDEWLEKGREPTFSFTQSPSLLSHLVWLFLFAGVGILMFARVISVRFDRARGRCTIRSWGLTGKKTEHITLQSILNAFVETNVDSDGDTYRVAIRLHDRSVPLMEVYSSGISGKEKHADAINLFLSNL